LRRPLPPRIQRAESCLCSAAAATCRRHMSTALHNTLTRLRVDARAAVCARASGSGAACDTCLRSCCAACGWPQTHGRLISGSKPLSSVPRTCPPPQFAGRRKVGRARAGRGKQQLLLRTCCCKFSVISWTISRKESVAWLADGSVCCW